MQAILYNIQYLNFPSFSNDICLVQWVAHLAAFQEVSGSITDHTLGIFLEVQGMEQGPPSLVRTIGQLLDMRSSEIWLRKFKLRLRNERFANHRAPCTSIWQLPFQSVLALWSCSAKDLFLFYVFNYCILILYYFLNTRHNIFSLFGYLWTVNYFYEESGRYVNLEQNLEDNNFERKKIVP